MKRLHVHVAVDDLDRSVAFYSTLFGAAPSVLKPDYAKWMLDDPRVNFAISARGQAPGLDHLGIQVEGDAELAELAGRLKAAGSATREQADATCCYARSNKEWVTDPSGLNWETFHTFGDAVVYGEDPAPEGSAETSCCTPTGDAARTHACC